jgi:hypothetical protein
VGPGWKRSGGRLGSRAAGAQRYSRCDATAPHNQTSTCRRRFNQQNRPQRYERNPLSRHRRNKWPFDTLGQARSEKAEGGERRAKVRKVCAGGKVGCWQLDRILELLERAGALDSTFQNSGFLSHPDLRAVWPARRFQCRWVPQSPEFTTSVRDLEISTNAVWRGRE